MPPAVSRYTQHMPTLSNPFPHLNQQQLQQAHLQHPGAPNIHAQNFGGQPGFGGQNPGLFGPSGGNSGLHGGNFGGGGGLGGGGTGLASHAAQSGFHGAGMQQQQHMYDGAMGGPVTKGANSRIREVWKTNLAQEMQLLRSLVDRYPYISMVSGRRTIDRRLLLTDSYVAGHRVPRRSSAAYGRIHNKSIISLSDTPLQRRPPENNTARNHAFLNGRRRTTSTSA